MRARARACVCVCMIYSGNADLAQIHLYISREDSSSESRRKYESTDNAARRKERITLRDDAEHANP